MATKELNLFEQRIKEKYTEEKIITEHLERVGEYFEAKDLGLSKKFMDNQREKIELVEMKHRVLLDIK